MHKAQRVQMSKATKDNPENTTHFTAFEKQLPLPFWFVADFEAIAETCDPELPEVPTSDVQVLDPMTGKMRYAEFV